jgi:hypothetical protein
MSDKASATSAEIIRLRAEIKALKHDLFRVMDRLNTEAEEVDRLSALVKPADTDGWQPIETAPKNGECVLVCRPGFYPEVTRWRADILGSDWLWLIPLPDEDSMRLKPTHWSPLPHPPKETPNG